MYRYIYIYIYLFILFILYSLKMYVCLSVIYSFVHFMIWLLSGLNMDLLVQVFVYSFTDVCPCIYLSLHLILHATANTPAYTHLTSPKP